MIRVHPRPSLNLAKHPEALKWHRSLNDAIAMMLPVRGGRNAILPGRSLLKLNDLNLRYGGSLSMNCDTLLALGGGRFRFASQPAKCLPKESCPARGGNFQPEAFCCIRPQIYSVGKP
jgi:hypothetical protein